MSALVSELNLSMMTRSEISARLFTTIEWGRISSSGVFLTPENRKLIEKAQQHLNIVLEDIEETKVLVSLFLQIADNCTFDLSIQLYIFTRIGEIFGLGIPSGSGSGSGTTSTNGSYVSKSPTSPVSAGGAAAGRFSSPYGVQHVVHFTRPMSATATPTSNCAVVDNAFLRAMTNPNVYLQSAAATALAFIYTTMFATSSVCVSASTGTSTGLDVLTNWAMTKMKGAVNDLATLQYALPTTLILCSQVYTRILLLQTGTGNGIGRGSGLDGDCLSTICSLLTKLGMTGNPQCIYELCFLLWTLSLLTDNAVFLGSIPNANSSGGHGNNSNISASDVIHQFHTCDTIKILVELLSAGPSRKIVRMCISTLHNLARTLTDDILVDMFSTNVLRHIENMVHKATMAARGNNTSDSASASASASGNGHGFGDTETEEARALLELLLVNHKELTTYDKYSAELHSGSLKWGIVHTEKFFKENSRYLEQNNFECLHLLLSYLHHASPTVVSIALFDIGEFARFFPNGRLLIKSLGGKDIALGLIESEDEEVQRHALQCVSKLLVNSWTMLVAGSV